MSMTTPPNAPEVDVLAVLNLHCDCDSSEIAAGHYRAGLLCEKSAAVAALLTREAALVAERDALRDVVAAYEVARQEVFDHCLSNGVFNAWGKAMDCTSLNDAHLLARNIDAVRAEAGHG